MSIVVLGISAFFHDSAAALIIDGNIISACEEERFTRIKHDASFPINAIKWCLSFSNLSLNNVDTIIFYEKPFKKLARILSTHILNAPFGLSSFLQSIPVWAKKKLFLKQTILHELKKIQNSQKKINILFSHHHLSHAASAYFLSSFEDAAILTIDGVGEWATASISRGKKNEITILKQLNFPNSIGLLYSSFTDYCGFKVNSGEYKLMGLAPYGNEHSEIYKKCRNAITNKLIDLKEDGSILINQSYFKYSVGRKMVNDEKWETLLGFGRRSPEMNLEQQYCDLALAIQNLTEEIVIKMAKEAKRITGSRYLCMAGGVALNAVANGKLRSLNLYEDIFIQPASGDGGGALGAALVAYHIYFKQPFIFKNRLFNPLLGPKTNTEEIKKAVLPFQAKYEVFNQPDLLIKKTAELLNDGFIIGWYQGRAEFGPRALGSRSILADARKPDMQSKLNLKIKFRESFRPFAPSTLAEDAGNYFEINYPSPYMLYVAKVKKALLKKVPDGFINWKLEDRLHISKSEIPAVTHIDGSARVQTVEQNCYPLFWNLLNSFKQLTGCSVLINTSFNVRNEPIVNSPEDAYKCFMRTGMDYLVVENLIFSKNDQPQWEESQDWQNSYELD